MKRQLKDVHVFPIDLQFNVFFSEKSENIQITIDNIEHSVVITLENIRIGPAKNCL